MADTKSAVHIGENSPEEVAFKLMTLIATVENRQTYSHGTTPADRKYLLDLYVECFDAVRGLSRPK